ncbi:MAG TPA: hypothetical protein VH351_10670 [Bryobacteraceae bacterium]|jgi:hypothetical protein|nr:hypothetical protein [Bryobacteraceae bacterium]
MYSRRAKESHRDTIAYEADMLAFCAQTLRGRKHPTNEDMYVYLEAFLLDYRNLIGIFSGENHRRDDLSTADTFAWSDREMTPEETTAIRAPALALDAKYFQPISKYLQHCTTLRHDHDRGWDIDEMLAEISPIIALFEKAFPRLPG